ncbi:hypothetical protein ACFQ1S_26980, partial [Kibdelosporangium lantanae]
LPMTTDINFPDDIDEPGPFTYAPDGIDETTVNALMAEMDDLHQHLFTVLMDREWPHGVAAAGTHPAHFAHMRRSSASHPGMSQLIPNRSNSSPTSS